MKARSFAALGAALLLPTALAACGTTEASEGSGSDALTSKECSEDTTETATGPVELTDSYGRTVQLDQPAEEVAVLEWQQTEDLLSLCVTPTAVADTGGYSTWVSAEELPEGVTDVGSRQEPNLEKLFSTDPDLVVVEAYSPDDEIIKRLEKYGVPVLATKGADADDPIGTMKETFSLIAEATGRSERADVVLDQFDQTLSDAKQEVAAADVSVDEFVYFDGYVQGGNVAFRPFGQGSLVGELGEELGLTNAWEGEVDPAYGLGQADIEAMADVGEATFFHTGTVDPSGSIFDELENNELWAQIPAVAEDRIHAFPEGIWTFGGPRSSEQVVEAYVDILTQ